MERRLQGSLSMDINFIYGTDGLYTNSNFLVKPQVGDFYIFPRLKVFNTKAII